jgi:hypothetical protein
MATRRTKDAADRTLRRRRLTDEQIASILSSDPVDEAGMPFGPGSVLNLLRLGKSIPGVARRLRGLLQAKPQSTAQTNVLRDIVISQQPANLSRRGFLTSPLQAAVDLPQALREIGVTEESIKSGDEIGWWPELAEKGTIFHQMRYKEPLPSVRVITGRSTDGRVIEPLIETGYRTTPYEGPRGTILRDLETMGRVYRDQVLKEAAQEVGRSFQEEKEVQRKKYEEPGAIAKAVKEIRRRYRR